MLYVRGEIVLIKSPVRGNISTVINTIDLSNLKQILLPLLDFNGNEDGSQGVWISSSDLDRLQESNAWPPVVKLDQHEQKTVYLPDKQVARVFGGVNVVYC